MASPLSADDVRELANAHKALPKLTTLAETWKVSELDIYDTFKHLSCSITFLRDLVKLSSIVDWETGKDLVAKERDKRGSSKSWALGDAKGAIAEASRLSKVKRPGDLTLTGPLGASTHQSVFMHKPSETNDNTMIKPASKSAQSSPGEASENATPSGGHEGKPRRLGERKAAVALRRPDSPRTPVVRSADSKRPFPETADPRLPVTPGSGVSELNVHLQPSASTKLTALTTSCNPLKRKRYDTEPFEGDGTLAMTDDEADDHSAEEPCFLDDHAIQAVFDRLSSHRFINDDCINMVLQAFNPDPTRWYMATSYLLKVGDPTGTVPSSFKDVSGLPRMLLFPLHIANAAHWALAVYDRERRHCDVFDARKDSSAAAPCWKTVESFLVKHGVLKGNATVDLDPFPSVQQTDDVNCGVYVVAVALHVLHGVTVNRISPELWRSLLASFFSKGTNPPRDSVVERLGGIAKSTVAGQQSENNIESRMGEVEETKTEELKVLSYAEQTKSLSAIVETQLRVVAKREGERQKLIDMEKWYSAMPKHGDMLIMEMVIDSLAYSKQAAPL
ncbi:hypothetical protein KC353_g230 [Hortaea werneckii]|nr:hypothetical protein KC353_g230 [Hortaea werneckii]